MREERRRSGFEGEKEKISEEREVRKEKRRSGFEDEEKERSEGREVREENRGVRKGREVKRGK